MYLQSTSLLLIFQQIKCVCPALSATAQTTVNPGNANSWTSSGVVRLTGVDQSGVAAGFERTIFEVDASIHASRFLRLVFTLN